MLDQISASLKVFAVQMKPYNQFVFIGLVIAIVILFIIFVVLVMYAKKNTYIKPIHTVKLEKAAETGSHEGMEDELKAIDAFKLPPFLYGFSEPLEKYLTSGSFAKLFFKAQEFIERSLEDKYALSWYAILGATDSGKTAVVNSLESYLGSNLPDFDQKVPRDYCQFSFFNEAVMLNLNGDFFIRGHESTSSENGFRTFMTLLSRYRMKRPLNGMILTIPLTEVFGKDALNKVEIQKRAVVIREKLSILQENLGVRLPVYVFFTKLDLIPGFDAFMEAVPDHQIHNALGWSLEQWSKKSVDEGFEKLGKHFKRLLTQLLIRIDDPKTAGKAFLFMKEVMRLDTMLSFYLNQIFTSDSYHVTPVLRGFYFTGMQDKNVLFVRDIVQEKIFLENGIVYPIVHFLGDKRALFRHTQLGVGIACVILGFGFWKTKQRFDMQKEAIMPVLHNFVSLSNQMRLARSDEVEKMKYISEETLRNLNKLSDITSQRFMFFSFVIPATWFSPYRSYLKTTLHQSVQLLIVGSLYTYLTQKMKDLSTFNIGVLPTSTNIGSLMFPCVSREFKLLRYYVKAVQELSRHVEQYNYLGSSTTIKDFNSLFKYCFGESLPVDFQDNFYRINKFLGNKEIDKIDLTMQQRHFQTVLAKLFQHFYNSLFDRANSKSLIAQLQIFAKTLNPMDTNLYMTINDLRDTSITLSSQIEALGDKRSIWMDGTYFDPGLYINDEFVTLVKDVQGHYLFGDAFAHVILMRFNQGFIDFKKAMREFNRFLYPDMSHEEMDRKPVSDGVFVIEKALRFLKLLPPYDNREVSVNIEPNDVVYWPSYNINLIYSKVGEGGIDEHSVPPILAPQVKTIYNEATGGFARSALIQDMRTEKMIDADTPTIEIESYLRHRKDFIKQFGKELLTLLKRIEKQNVGFEFFKHQLGKTAIYYLTLLDRLLETEAMYLPQTLSHWDGKSTIDAFGTTKKSMVEKYLQAQLSRLLFFKSIAEPLVVFLNSPMMESEFNDKALLVKWERFVTAVSQHEKGEKAGALSDLETFITKEMQDLTAEKVYETIEEKNLDMESLDFFKRRLALLKHSILMRAEEILRLETIEHYNTLRNYFDKHLKGRFPFSRVRGAEARLEDVKKFFELYDKIGGAPDKILRKIDGLENYDKALYWVKNIHAIREMFSSFIEGRSKAPEIEFEWDFRVNRARENNGQHVMDFKLRSGLNKELVFISADKQFSRWVFGDPIEVGFEWSKTDGKKIFPLPTPDSVQPQLMINGKKASFIYNDVWALFSLLHLHLNGEGFLKFEIPQDDGDKFIGYNKIRFVKPGLAPQDPKQFIEFTAVPTDAPPLLRDERVVQNQQDGDDEELPLPVPKKLAMTPRGMMSHTATSEDQEVQDD